MNAAAAADCTAHVKSVDRAISILDLLAREKREMTLSEIAQELGWAKSTAHGLLVTLRDHHLVDQSLETSRYRLGIRLFELGTQVSSAWDVRTAARPSMIRLMREFGETVQLGTEDAGAILYLDKLSPSTVTSIMSEVGQRLPMHCSGLGKVLLSEKSPEELRRFVELQGLESMTSRTITTLEDLERELDRVREQGFAMDDGEIVEGLRCVAVPICDARGTARYALSISGQARNITTERVGQIVEALKQAAEETSQALGLRQAGE